MPDIDSDQLRAAAARLQALLPPEPGPGQVWRVGRRKPRHVYVHQVGDPDGFDLVTMPTVEYAALVCDAANAWLASQAPNLPVLDVLLEDRDRGERLGVHVIPDRHHGIREASELDHLGVFAHRDPLGPDGLDRGRVRLPQPFGGTGTTALVADVHGRHGISADMSADYCRLAQWRTSDPGERARALGVPKPPPVGTGQGDLFDGVIA